MHPTEREARRAAGADGTEPESRIHGASAAELALEARIGEGSPTDARSDPDKRCCACSAVLG